MSAVVSNKKTPATRKPREQALVVAEKPAAPTTTSESTAILALVERAAKDPTVDIDKMERLMAMHERHVAKQAEMAFSEALSAMQPDMPSILERGVIRNKAGGIQSTYALWEDINEAIKPVLKNHGFALSFLTDCNGGIKVIGVLSHRAGHSVRTEIILPADSSGGKNAVQAVASSISYGKRYTAGALLNLTSHGEDDDGNFGNGTDRSQESQQQEFYPQSAFEENLPDWTARIKSGRQEPDRLIGLIESKGIFFTEEQKTVIRKIEGPSV